MPTLSISKSFEFSASHRLARPDWDAEKNAEVYGKCSNARGHGHNYRLEVAVSGQVNPETGMLINASLLDTIVSERIVRELDHKHLDEDVAWLQGSVTTVENLIQVVWQRIAEALQEEGLPVHLKKLTLWETRRICAVLEES